MGGKGSIEHWDAWCFEIRTELSAWRGGRWLCQNAENYATVMDQGQGLMCCSGSTPRLPTRPFHVSAASVRYAPEFVPGGCCERQQVTSCKSNSMNNKRRDTDARIRYALQRVSLKAKPSEIECSLRLSCSLASEWAAHDESMTPPLHGFATALHGGFWATSNASRARDSRESAVSMRGFYIDVSTSFHILLFSAFEANMECL